jgi:hypothetical protein
MDPITIGIGFCLVVALLATRRFKPKLVKLKAGEALLVSRSIDLPVFGPKGQKVHFEGAYVIPRFDN